MRRYRRGLLNIDVPASPKLPSDPQQPAPDPSSTPPSKPSLLESLRSAPVATLIIALNGVVFALAERSGSTSQSETLLRFGASWRGLVWQGEYWRLLTANFLHIGVIHLLWNGYYGFLISTQVERTIGSKRFVALYLMTGIAGSAASVIGHNAVSAGASGALFGLIGWQVATMRAHLGSFRALWDTPAIRRQLSWVGAWFVLGAFAGFDNYAHAGGLAFGLLFTWALVAPPARRMARLSLALLAFAALVGLSLRPLPLIHTEELARWKASRAPGIPGG
ncbi:MAG TPA: rhomboid family intramembrane serine protease [Polyangiaceae bacterium]|nr:rhomboid family intramembrane serine protease [Polyangiaceae bacterium]